MKTSKTNLSKYEYFSDTNTLYWEWQEATKNTSWDEFKKDMIEYAEMAEKYKPKNHIVNEKNQHVTLIPEYQLWIDKNVSTRTIASGCERIAIIKNDNFFEEVAVQQLFEEDNSQALQLGMFNNFNEALAWIKESAKP